jgi:ATP-dependent RNA helicase DDX24/MAK5
MSLAWKSVQVGPPPPDDHDTMAFFGLEEFTGAYDVVDGQIIARLDASAEPGAHAVEQQGAETGVAPAAIAAGARTKPKKKKKNKKPKPATPVAEEKPVEEVPPPPASAWDEYGLHPSLVQALVLDLKFASPTPVQAQALPAALVRGKDVLGCAETGSGKTLAYGLPMLNDLLLRPPEQGAGLAALVLAPTRELAMQVVAHFRAVLGREPLATRPRVEALVGGMALAKQERVLSKCPAVVVATCGRLLAVIASGNAHLAALPTSLRFLVLDEADRMLDKAHYSDLAPLVHLLKSTVAKRQTFLFSATLLMPQAPSSSGRGGKAADPISALMHDLGRRGEPELCHVVQDGAAPPLPSSPQEGDDDAPAAGAKPQTALPATLRLAKIACTDEEKVQFLYYFCTQYTGSVLVFVNTIAQAKRLAGVLNLLLSDKACMTLHANMEQKQRLRHLDRFKAGLDKAKDTRVLIATDVAARGLDIPLVHYVVQFSIPVRSDAFVHRSGRTARAGQQGLVLSLVSGAEQKAFGRIERELDLRTPALPVDETVLPRIKTRVRLASRIFAIDNKQRNEQMDKQWVKKNAREMELQLDDEDDDAGGETLNRAVKRQDSDSKQRAVQRELAELKQELKAAMAQELCARGKSRLFVAGSAQSLELLDVARNVSVKRSALEDLDRPVVKAKKVKRG